MKTRHTSICVPPKAWTSLVPAFLASIALAGLVAGCGGSGSGTAQEPFEPPPPVEPPPPATGSVTKAGGIWGGVWITGRTGLPSKLVAGVITEDHSEGRILSVNGQMLVLKNIVVANGRISADVLAFARPHWTLAGGNLNATGHLSGTITERTRIEADLYLSSGGNAELVLEYDELYERGSDIAWLVGAWEASHGLVCNVDALGEIFAQSEHGCVYAGRVSLMDAGWNVYRVDIADHCLAAEAGGLGVLTDDGFVLMLDLGNGWFMAEVLVRQ